MYNQQYIFDYTYNATYYMYVHVSPGQNVLNYFEVIDDTII